jgi:hypothetical protein
MARSALRLFADPEEGVDARGDVLEKDDRSLAAQRFRQVAPATDETFISRVALRRLCTQVVSDHFFGVVVAAARAINPKTAPTGVPSPQFREDVDDLLGDLRQLLVEKTTNESIELSIAQLRGAAEWDSNERYPSLAVFVRDEKAQASFAKAMSGQDAPALFERLLAKAERSDGPVPRIYRRIWDNTHWWGDTVCSRTLGALLRLCLTRNIQFHFRGNLTLIDLNAAALTRLNQRWQILLCTGPVREAVKHVARTLSMPVVCLPMPIARLGIMKGFDADLIELRKQNALISDSLVCFPADHSAAAPLTKKLVHRLDAIDVLASLPELIESLPAEDGNEPELAVLAAEIAQDEYQLSLW